MAYRLPTNQAPVSVAKESDAAEYSLSSSGFSVDITDRHTQNIHHTPNTHIHLCEHTHTKLTEIKKKCILVVFHWDMQFRILSGISSVLSFTLDLLLQVFNTYSNEDYDRRNDEVDPVAASAEYELEKRVEKLELFPVELEKGMQ